MKIKVTDALLKDHLLINVSTLEQFAVGNPRFEKICLTLHRAVKAHAWFEDEIFLPAIEAEPLLFRRFTDEIYQEHKDIDALLKLLRKTPMANKKELEFYSRTGSQGFCCPRTLSKNTPDPPHRTPSDRRGLDRTGRRDAAPPNRSPPIHRPMTAFVSRRAARKAARVDSPLDMIFDNSKVPSQ